MGQEGPDQDLTPDRGGTAKKGQDKVTRRDLQAYGAFWRELNSPEKWEAPGSFRKQAQMWGTHWRDLQWQHTLSPQPWPLGCDNQDVLGGPSTPEPSSQYSSHEIQPQQLSHPQNNSFVTRHHQLDPP